MNLKRTVLAMIFATGASNALADPLINSWFTDYAGKYARVYTTDANKEAGVSAATWSNASSSITQSLPAYCGIQEVSYSTDWVYIHTSGLGSHIMGPWYMNAGHTQAFVNVPKNQNVIYRFPRTPAVPVGKTLTGLGAIGYLVDGVALFDGRDAFYWNGSAEAQGTGSWNRNAYVNEGVTFDPAQAHQEGTGTYHCHANPIALRYLLGDHIDMDPTYKTFSESTGPVAGHSPLLGWVRDGIPLYGPYGYSDPLNASSGVRRMISGYQLRNGQNGADNVTTGGRSSIPQWAVRLGYASVTGPTVSTTYPLGRYMEDNAYLGDLINPADGQPFVLGEDFDLDEYNGRFCVTPEFPGGTYAYFVTIESDGSPKFPYNVGRAFYGSPTGSAVTSVTETVTTQFEGGEGIQETMAAPSVNQVTGDVTLTWSSIEGGTYQIETTDDFSMWTELTPTVQAAANAVQTAGVETGAATDHDQRFYRVRRLSVASYDGGDTGGTGGNGILSVSPTSGARGTTFTLTINLDPNANPAPPPQMRPVNSVTVGAIAGTNRVHVSQTVVTATITIPAGAATGPQTVTVVFPGPPANPGNTVTYTLTNGFTIN